MLPVYILTCPGREESLKETLASVAGSDWPEAPRVVPDPGTGYSERSNANPIARGHLAVLRRALDDGAPHFLVLEDDVRVNRWLHHNLTRWEPLRRGVVHFALLGQPVSALELCSHLRFLMQQERDSIRFRS
jgi:hypothetical protein